jgi:long-subunit acyl-CoA synthetase (AMP-forming)
LGYVSTAKPPQGEIWLRGPNVFKGYFKRPELDAAAFTEDGWFKTGDIGQVSSASVCAGCTAMTDGRSNTTGH